MLRITYAYHGHHAGYCFDWEALSSELSRAGFSNVVRHRAGESKRSGFESLETRIESTESAMELIVEAEKLTG
jgi:hypothetical protein